MRAFFGSLLLKLLREVFELIRGGIAKTISGKQVSAVNEEGRKVNRGIKLI